MHYVRVVRYTALLLVWVILLGACGGESTGRDVSSASRPVVSTAEPENLSVNSTPNPNATPTSTPVPQVTVTACMDVKSHELYPGYYLDKYMCLEGTITTIQLDSKNNFARISFDTTTGNSGGTLYTIDIYISDMFAYGVENLDKVFRGARVRAKGIYIQANHIGQYFIKVSRPDEIEVLFSL